MAEPLRYVLTDAEFDVVWERLGLGATPAALRIPSPGRTRAERLRIAADGLRGLRARGLAGPSGPDPGLVRLLGLLARPRLQLEVRGWFGHPLRAVAAERDGEGAVAVHADRTIAVSAAGSPAHAAVSALPRRRPGPGPAVVVPAALLERVLDAGRTGGALRPGVPAGPEPGAATGTGDPLGEPEARLRRMLHGPPHRAQVCAVRYDRWGSPHRPSGQVAVVDGAAGRYRLTRDDPTGGPGWVTLAPVDDRRLRPLLAGLLELSPGPSAA